MIWNKKTATVGECKTKTYFAWLPVELDEPKHSVIWLEPYKKDLKYAEYGYGGRPYAWWVVKTYR